MADPIWNHAIPAVLLVGGGVFLAVGAEGLGPGNEEAGIAILVTVMGALAVLFVLMLMIWPIYYVLADTDMGFEMVGKGFRVGLKNCLIAIPIFFVAGLAMMMGVVACGIGVIATIPAGQAMIATAYLNMSGQLQAR